MVQLFLHGKLLTKIFKVRIVAKKYIVPMIDRIWRGVAFAYINDATAHYVGILYNNSKTHGHRSPLRL